jgi:uncharacterized protein
MRVLLEQVRESPVEWHEDVELSPELLDPEPIGREPIDPGLGGVGHEGASLASVGPVSCRGRISAVEDGVLIQADLRYEQTLLCDRCLEPVTVPVSERIELLAVKLARENEVANELELKREDLDVVAVEDDEIDTDPLVVEQVLLNVPMKQLCSEACRGLCPRCGANLNRGSCDCPADADPRWSALAALRDKVPQ